MFGLLCDFAFLFVKPVMSYVLRQKDYPEDAILRKYAIFDDNGFKKEDKVIMVHGVSVGEVNALENLVKKIRENFGDYKIVLTTGTHTGQDIAKKKLSQYVDLITYFPADFPCVVKKFLDKINPDIVLIAETEIWPNFAIECKRRDIKTYIINGRISDSTFKSYKSLKLIFKYFLSFYSGIYTQSDEDNKKFIEIGAKPEITKRMNNLKFDIKKPDEKLHFDKSGSRILLAGSTHKGEDEIVFFIYRKLKLNHPDLKLIIAPRHITRVEEVRAMAESFSFKYDFRSNEKNNMENIDVLIVDTLGELGRLYEYSDISFIGGSFNKTGGHNPLESIIFEKPVISGPSIHNFKDIYSIIKNAGAGFIVEDKNEFYETANRLLSDNEFYLNTTKDCAKVFKEQQGALEFVLNLLK